MRVRAHMPQPGRQTRTAVLMIMPVLLLVVMIVAGFVVAGVRVAHEAQDACKTLLQHLNISAPDAPANWSLSWAGTVLGRPL